MEFPCHLHGVSMQFSSCQSLCFADAGTCKEPPWNLHGTSMETPSKLHSSTRWHRRAEQKRKHVEIAFVKNYIKPPSKIHGISMESAWVRPLEPPREQRQNPTSKLHGNYINSSEIYLDLPIRQKKSCGNNVNQGSSDKSQLFDANWSQIDRILIVNRS